MSKIRPVFCFLCLLPLLLTAQNEEIKIDKWDFGILFGTNGTRSNIETYPSSEIGFSNELKSVESIRGAGPELGILLAYHCTPLLSVKTEPSLGLTETSYVFNFEGVEIFSRTHESVNMELPLHLLIEPQGKKFTPAFTVGGRYVKDLTNTSQLSAIGNFPFAQEDIMLDVGLGVAASFKKFKMRYEFMYSKGLLNQSVSELAPAANNPFSEVFNNRLRARLVFYM